MKVFHLLLLTILLINCNAYTRRNRPYLQKRPIVGGTDARITSVPYQVSLGNIRHGVDYDDDYNVIFEGIMYIHFCGGSIISVEWVLTAAHCVKYNPDEYENKIEKMHVRVGSEINKEGGTLHKIARIIFDPEFDYNKIEHDVAVIKVKEPFEFGPKVQPISLTNYPIVPGGIVTVSGWGALSDYGGRPGKLQKVQIPIMPQWECKMHYRKDRITDYMFCAGRAGHSSCFGDSGGPVVYNGVQIGIVSWGRSCQKPDYPGVYANVLKMRDWIHKHSGV